MMTLFGSRYVAIETKNEPQAKDSKDKSPILTEYGTFDLTFERKPLSLREMFLSKSNESKESEPAKVPVNRFY